MKKYTLPNTKPCINASAQRFLDQSFAQETKLPTLILMEQAAMAISNLIMELDPNRKKYILFLAGKGNNGGDAYCSARQLLAKGYKVHILEIFPNTKLPPDATQNRFAYKTLNGKISKSSNLNNFDLEPYDIIVDGIMGTGFHLSRPLETNILQFLNKINSDKNTIKIAIDIPTGIESFSGACDQVVFKADYTVTFSAYKTALYADPGTAYCGKIILDDITMPADWLENKLVCFQKEEILPRVLNLETFQKLEIEKDSLSHKGKAGKTLIVGGAPGMSGAIHLAIRAAHATGVGYVYGRLSQDLITSLIIDSPQSLIDVYPDSKEDWLSIINQVDSIAIGPGAGEATWLDNSLNLLIKNAKNLIIDADGLNYLASLENWQELTKQRKQMSPIVLTPHPGEFKRLEPELVDLLAQDRQQAASDLAKSSGTIVILKGHRTVIALPNGEIYLNSSGNQGLGKAGSGDVLTGLIAGFAAQMENIAIASCLAVYFHGLLGDLAKTEKGIRNMQPSDLLNFTKKAYLLLNWYD